MLEAVFPLLLFLGVTALPALCVVAAWACLSKVRWPYRHCIALISGLIFSPASWIAAAIYASEGGGDDSDPMTFVFTVLGVAGGVSLLTVAIIDWRECRQ
ncbi:MAG TPA: hypothetical protein VF440_13855 [Novosphingobium sp.]